jgi:hypothetical protein
MRRVVRQAKNERVVSGTTYVIDDHDVTFLTCIWYCFASGRLCPWAPPFLFPQLLFKRIYFLAKHIVVFLYAENLMAADTAPGCKLRSNRKPFGHG